MACLANVRNLSFLAALGVCLSPSLLLGQAETVDAKSIAGLKETVLMEKRWCETLPPFEIRVGVPTWLAGLSGESGVGGLVSSTDITFGQTLRHLTHVPIVGGGEIRYQRWEFFADGQYTEVGASASLPGLLFTTANLHATSGLAEAFLGYRLINCSNASLSVFAGARYTYQGLKLSIFDNGDARLPRLRQLLGLSKKLEADGSTDWVDPVIGARGKIRVWKAVALYAEGDVGGFDVNADTAFELRSQAGTIVKRRVSASDWSYQLQGGVEIELTRGIWSQIGWRYLKYDYASAGFSNRTELSGPFIQTGINF